MPSLGGGRRGRCRPGIIQWSRFALFLLHLASVSVVGLGGCPSDAASVSVRRRTSPQVIPSRTLDSPETGVPCRARVPIFTPNSVSSRCCSLFAAFELHHLFTFATEPRVATRSEIIYNFSDGTEPRSVSTKSPWNVLRIISARAKHPHARTLNHTQKVASCAQLEKLRTRLCKCSNSTPPSELHRQTVRICTHTRVRKDGISTPILMKTTTLLFSAKDWLFTHEIDGGVPDFDVSLAPFTGLSYRSKYPIIYRNSFRFYAARLPGLVAVKKHTGKVSYVKNIITAPLLVLQRRPASVLVAAVSLLTLARNDKSDLTNPNGFE